MSTLYGDNIFESKDAIIDRLFESIQNDITLFENYNIINEGVKEVFSNLIDSIKKLITRIKEAIRDFIAKITGKIAKEKQLKDLTNKKLPFKWGYIDIPKYNELFKLIDKCYSTIIDMNMPINTKAVNVGKIEMAIEKYYFGNKDEKRFNVLIIYDVDTEDGRQKAINLFNKNIDPYKKAVTNINGQISRIEKDINQLNSTINHITGGDENVQGTLVNYYKFKLENSIKVIKYYKDLVRTIEEIALKSIYVYDEKDLKD